MIVEPTGDEMATANERGRELVDELYSALGKVCDRETAYLSAMQILLSRSGLGPQKVVDQVTALLAHNLCNDEPIRLTIEPLADEQPSPDITKH